MKPRVKAGIAAKHSILLSLFFIVLYSTCTFITAHRSDIGAFYFEWERHIPFIEWMIFPYMSIDLFFVAAPFLCSDRDELSAYSRRIIFAISAAALFFIICPLTFSFEHTPLEGWLGSFFNHFRKVDLTYNQFPSLHIVLLMIVGATFVKHTQGWLRTSIIIWFGLIATSTLLTHQHHIIDLLGGFILSLLCFYLFPDTPIAPSNIKNTKVALYYGTLGLLLFSISLYLISIYFNQSFLLVLGLLLLWPALSLILITSAYLGLSANIYRKTDGQISIASRILHAPALLGQKISWLHYKRKAKAWDFLEPHILMGRKPSNSEAEELIRNYNVKSVLDLTVEFDAPAAFLQKENVITYLNVPVLDLTAPSLEQMNQISQFIDEQQKRGVVYVHCKVGYSRTAAAIGAYLIHTEKASSIEEVLRTLKKARPTTFIRPEVIEILKAYLKTKTKLL